MIRLVVLIYVRSPLLLRNVEDLLFESGIDICHLPLRRRERTMLRFRQMKALQNFAPVNANLHNHFSLERHLVDRKTYKERRSAALAERRSLAS